MKRKQDEDDQGEAEQKERSGNKKQKLGPRYVAMDFETTGINPETDEIVQVGLIKFDYETEDMIDEFKTLVKPSKGIPQSAEDVHHLSDADVSDAPSWKEVAPLVIEFIGNCGLVGHNLIKFDLPILQAELKRAKLPLLDCTNRSLLDTLCIFKAKEPHTLAKAAKFYWDIDYGDEYAHNAYFDAQACMRVLYGQKKHYPDLFDDIHAVERLCQPKVIEYFEEFTNEQGKKDVLLTVGKHKGKRASEIRKTDRGYWTWMVNKEKTNKTKWYAILQSI